MRRAIGMAIVAGVLVAGLSGCGERPQVVNYKQGTYQGKPDSPPYANDTFKNDRAEWERTIRTRQQAQNEYKRIGG